MLAKNFASLWTQLLNLRIVSGLVLILTLLFIPLWDHLPAEDPENYFKFADSRHLLGINNFSDVISNLALPV